MHNIKKAAQNISSKLGLQNPHTSLVVTISEERQIYETLIKLILYRVNSSTSLLKWAKGEKNQVLRESMGKLYDMSLMFSTVQTEFAEKNRDFCQALKEILQVEASLDAMRKNIADAGDKIEKLRKQVEGIGRKSDVNRITVIQGDIARMCGEVEEMQAELEIKEIKAEIFKSSKMRSCMSEYVKAHLRYADRMTMIFTAASRVVEEIPDVPAHLKMQKGIVKSNTDDVVPELARCLKIDRPVTSSNVQSNSVFHVELPMSESRTEEKSSALKQIMGKLSVKGRPPASLFDRPRMPLPTEQKTPDTRDVWEPDLSDFVVIPSRAPPKEMPPPIPGFRGRSKSSIDRVPRIYAKPFGREVLSPQPSGNEYAEYGPYEQAPYVEARVLHPARLYRSASDSTLSSHASDSDNYCEPWDQYLLAWASCDQLNARKKLEEQASIHNYDTPYDALVATDKNALADEDLGACSVQRDRDELDAESTKLDKSGACAATVKELVELKDSVASDGAVSSGHVLKAIRVSKHELNPSEQASRNEDATDVVKRRLGSALSSPNPAPVQRAARSPPMPKPRSKTHVDLENASQQSVQSVESSNRTSRPPVPKKPLPLTTRAAPLNVPPLNAPSKLGEASPIFANAPGDMPAKSDVPPVVTTDNSVPQGQNGSRSAHPVDGSTGPHIRVKDRLAHLEHRVPIKLIQPVPGMGQTRISSADYENMH